MEDYVELITALRYEHNPETATETILVGRMAESEWLRARAAQLQTQTIFQEADDQEKKLNLYIRYAKTHENSFYKALKELQSIRKQKLNSEIGFKSQELKQEAAVRAVERQNLTREGLAFKKDELLFKKEVFLTKKVVIKGPKRLPTASEWPPNLSTSHRVSRTRLKCVSTHGPTPFPLVYFDFIHEKGRL